MLGRQGAGVMPTTFGTPAYWQERAEEARALAEDMNDAEARRAMLAVAENYEKIAKRAEAKGTGPFA
jgi:hypothetical protein